MEAIWKIIIITIDWCLEDSIEFHDVLHGYRERRNTVPVTLEVKILQNIAGMCQAVLYKIYFDMHKMYNALDWGCALAILEGYRMVPQVC